MLQLSRLFRVYRYPGSLLCLSNDLQHFLFSVWTEASQWPNFYMCLMKLSLTNRDLLPLQHDLPTENDQTRWWLYHWASYYLLWNAAHRQWMLFCPFQPPPARLFICPFHFHSPGSLWDFFFHWIMILKVIVQFRFFFFPLAVCMCVSTPSVCLWSGWAQVRVLVWLSSGQFNFLPSMVSSDILLLLLAMFWSPVKWEG